MASLGCGMKWKNPLRPKTKNMSPIRTRAICGKNRIGDLGDVSFIVLEGYESAREWHGGSLRARCTIQKGGTGLRPVRSGILPDFGRGEVVRTRGSCRAQCAPRFRARRPKRAAG